MSEKEQPSNFSEADTQKMKMSKDVEESTTEDKQPISTQLHLVAASKSLDKGVVLRRIRHRKCMNKVKNTFSSLLSLNGGGAAANGRASIAQENKWADLGDDFFCP